MAGSEQIEFDDCYLYPRGSGWYVRGPVDVVKVGATVKAFLPGSSSYREVTIAEVTVVEDEGVAIGYPPRKPCSGLSGRCLLARVHRGWCRG